MRIPTDAEVRALAYGGSVQRATIPTDAEVRALPYASTPYDKGLLGEVRRDRMRTYGERVAWLRAVKTTIPIGEFAPNAQGYAFIARHLSEDVRVFLFQNAREAQSEPIGEIGDGRSLLQFMPDEISPMRLDRFVAIDKEPASVGEMLAVSSQNVRSLQQFYPIEITEIYSDGQKLRPSTYALRNSKLVWIGPVPTSEVFVRYRYCLTFEWADGEIKTGPMGADGVRLPSALHLKLLTAGE